MTDKVIPITRPKKPMTDAEVAKIIKLLTEEFGIKGGVL